jgi:hypothetical protein
MATSDKGEFKFTRICPGRIRLQVDFSSGPHGSGQLKAAAGDHGIRAIMGQERVHVNYHSLLGQALPDLAGFGLQSTLSEAEDQSLLICFFDQQQRSSRELVRKLASQAESLAEQGRRVVLIQATAMDVTALRTWRKKENIPFSCGMVTQDAEKTHLAWGPLVDPDGRAACGPIGRIEPVGNRRAVIRIAVFFPGPCYCQTFGPNVDTFEDLRPSFHSDVHDSPCA